jgi:hypothetical protein
LRGLQDLAEIVRIHGALRFFAHGADGGNDDRGENADDRDDREQFDEREGGTASDTRQRTAVAIKKR